MLISFLFTSACTHRRTYCLLCHGDRWPTGDRRWWSGRHTPWLGKVADPALPRGRRHDCWSWRNTSPHAGTVSSGCKESRRPKTENTKAQFCHGYSDPTAHLCASDLCKSSLLVSHKSCWLISLEWGILFWSRHRILPPKQTAISVLPLASSPPQWLLKELGNKVLLLTSGSRRTLQYFTPFRSLREKKKLAVRNLWSKGMPKGKTGSCSGWVFLALKSKTNPEFHQQQIQALCSILPKQSTARAVCRASSF